MAMTQSIEQSETLPRYSEKALQIAQARVHWQEVQARTPQLPPEANWLTWLILSGRGWGKTRTGAEWIVWEAIRQPKTRWAVIAKTHADIRDTCFEGESGIISVLKRYNIFSEKSYNRSNYSYSLPNGSRIKGFSAEEPDRLRGPQHHGGWLDELAAWEKPEAYDQYKFGLRLGNNPKSVITTTPRPTKLIKELIADDNTHVTRGSTFDNSANLAASALLELQRKYADTRLGQQELYGAILDDNPGALWSRAMIESARVTTTPPFVRVVVGVDPAVTSGEDSDYTGIVTAGMSSDGHYYILSDDTIKSSPQEWAMKAIQSFEAHKADRIIAETNNGGDLVLHLFQQVKSTIPVRKVTATRGKQVRAEPIAALYEQGRVHHVGYFAELEDQMCEYEPGVTSKSPDRMDALVWALTDLSEGSASMNFLASLATFCPACRIPVPKSSNFCPKCNTAIGETNAISSNQPNS